LLFALPTQNLEEVRLDVATALHFSPAHVSAYCLTVPEGHKLSVGRAPDEEQGEMFELIDRELASGGIYRYEISNFAKPGFESRHNLLYWTDQPYWGIGLSSHSYFPRGFSSDDPNDWGRRFWNVRAIKRYEDEMTSSRPSLLKNQPADLVEHLTRNQALSDFCHTSLRIQRGLEANALRLKFGEPIFKSVEKILTDLVASGHVETTSTGWTLTAAGRLVANLVFEKLTFLEDSQDI
jgi:oxygen-independent coproporphyrinogen-3 oxidase